MEQINRKTIIRYRPNNTIIVPKFVLLKHFRNAPYCCNFYNRKNRKKKMNKNLSHQATINPNAWYIINTIKLENPRTITIFLNSWVH